MALGPTTPEQRQEIYADVRDLIVPGFLAHTVEVAGVRLALRTLDATDWHLLRFRTHGLGGREWKSWVVSTSIWMVDGALVVEREKALLALCDMCMSLPRSVLDDLHGVVEGLLRRLRRAADVVEAYLYEAESRQLWKADGHAVLAAVDRRGLARSRNPIVRLWIYYNQLEDEREREDYLWTLAKFVAGPHVPKGIKKIHARDRERDTSLKKRRQVLLDRTYYEAKGLIPKAKKTLTPRQPGEYQPAVTEDDLREEMRRWIAGEKDEHDLVVEATKARIRRNVEQRRAADIQRREELAKAFAEEGPVTSRIVPLTGEAGQDYLDRLKSRLPGTRVVTDETPYGRVYEKYIKNPTAVGTLHVDAAGRIRSSVDADPQLLELLTKPDSLQAEVEGRRPTAVVGEDGEGGGPW